MTDDEFFSNWGVVRHHRWLAWGVNHGVMVRPRWLAHLIVDAWNWVSCHALGHEWVPDFCAEDGTIDYSPTREFCPNCDAKRDRP